MNSRLSFYVSAVAFLFAVVFFTTCAKEYSYEGGPANPVTGSSAAWSCTAGTVMGGYFAGVVLDTTNNIRLQVNVTTTGTYTLLTNTTNGTRFSASGTFTRTGPQTVTLLGEGAPVSEGNFVFSTTGAGCSFTITVNKLSGTMADYTMSGAPNACTEAVVNGNYVNGMPLNASNTVIAKVNVKTIGTYVIHTYPVNGISFSDSGTFIKTGDQTVILAGSGTPLQPDNLIFTPSSSSGNPGCGFEVTIVNHDPVATYALESGGDTATTCVYTLSGTYTKNTPLSGSNNVRINVFVTVLGNYTIATNTVNGIRFYHTGMFTIKGSQGVTLSGIGTPIAKGINAFTPQIVGPHPIGGQACGFSITVN